MLTETELGKSYVCLTDGCEERFANEGQLKVHRHKHDIMLNIGSKPSGFSVDQTPTPIRLLRNCEEMGLFHELESVNPFEETFRKAAEGIRTGSSNLETSTLSVPENTDDSLHTPNVIFPTIGEMGKVARRNLSGPPTIELPIIDTEHDPLSLSLSHDEDLSHDKDVVQQEADTSEDTQTVALDSNSREGVSSDSTIQFLLRMPSGKMVQLSSLPVERIEARSEDSKTIPIIKVDSSALENIMIGSGSVSPSPSPSRGSSFMNSFSSTSKSVVSSSGNIIGHNITSRQAVTNQPTNTVNKRVTSGESSESSSLSLVKQKLKQALINNSCPAATSTSLVPVAGSSSSSNGLEQHQVVRVRRPSSTHEDSQNSGSDSVEEKRRRNRAAAMRCREKRKTWVRELERRANEMLRTNGQLQCEVSMLRDEVAQLKTLLLAHRDCPVTQALVQGQAAPIPGTSTSVTVPTNTSDRQATVRGTGSTASPVKKHEKPIILLSDPPVKRKRLAQAKTPTSSSISSSPSGVINGSVSVSGATLGHTVVFSSVPGSSSSSATILNSGIVLPSVLVANPTLAPCSSGTGTSQVIAFQSVGPHGNLMRLPVAQNQQPFILPKSATEFWPQEDRVGNLSKARSVRIISSNVIKVNPNVVDVDKNSEGAHDSDIEILDVQ